MKISRFHKVSNIMQPQFKTCVVFCLYIILCLVHCIVLQGVYYLSSTGQATIRLYHIYIKTRCLCSIVKLPIEMAGCQFDRRQYFLPILTNYRTRGQIILITPSSFLLRMPGFTVRKIGYSDSTLPILTATATNVCYYTQAEKVMKTYHMSSLLSLPEYGESNTNAI